MEFMLIHMCELLDAGNTHNSFSQTSKAIFKNLINVLSLHFIRTLYELVGK